jgi:hypothetical protein
VPSAQSTGTDKRSGECLGQRDASGRRTVNPCKPQAARRRRQLQLNSRGALLCPTRRSAPFVFSRRASARRVPFRSRSRGNGFAPDNRAKQLIPDLPRMDCPQGSSLCLSGPNDPTDYSWATAASGPRTVGSGRASTVARIVQSTPVWPPARLIANHDGALSRPSCNLWT